MSVVANRKRLRLLCLALLASTLPASTQSQERDVSRAEVEDITKLLAIRPGMLIADVGAGYGGWTVEMARRVSDEGHVYATEVDPDRLDDIRENVTDAELTNVSIVWGSQNDTGLPPNCCDAIVLRRVYHHFTEPEAMRTSLRRAVRPDGVILIIDFEPRTRNWLTKPRGVPENRRGHGISKTLLVEEMSSAGFELLREVRPWNGQDYCLLFKIGS